MIRLFLIVPCLLLAFGDSQAVCVVGPSANLVLPITTYGQDTLQGSAFLWFDYGSSDSILFVTCKHMLEGQKRVRFSIDCSSDSGTTRDTISFPLEEPKTKLPLWFTSPDANIDAAILRVPLRQFIQHCSVHVRPVVKSGMYDLGPDDVGYNLTYVGFPLGFVDSLSNTPVIRRAMLCWAGRSKKLPVGTMLVEGHAAPGNSGSPVYIEEDSCKFVGMIAGLFPSKRWIVRDSTGTAVDTAYAPSGLSYLVTASAIQAMIDKYLAQHKK
jgi:hypothetical protein